MNVCAPIVGGTGWLIRAGEGAWAWVDPYFACFAFVKTWQKLVPGPVVRDLSSAGRWLSLSLSFSLLCLFKCFLFPVNNLFRFMLISLSGTRVLAPFRHNKKKWWADGVPDGVVKGIWMGSFEVFLVFCCFGFYGEGLSWECMVIEWCFLAMHSSLDSV